MSGTQESITASKARIYSLVQQCALGPQVLAALLPNGEPFLFEKTLWDYKIELPLIPAAPASKAQLDAYNAKFAEIIKDVVAFYNSLGGYLIIGVSDSPRQIVGYSGHFDCGELTKRIKGATQHTVDCHYSVTRMEFKGKAVDVGILQIPQRPDSFPPAQFRKDAPATDTGKRAYKAEDYYMRDGDESRPAQSPEDLCYLCSQNRRIVKAGGETNLTLTALPIVESNLGPRDPSFIKFVGREDYLQELWKWVCDPYSPVKLLAGLGGLGKTTIVREFAEDVSRVAPFGIQKVIWLSAKQQFYAAIADKFVATSRVDFEDVHTLLKALLSELGHPDDTLDADASREDLIDQTIETFRLFPSLVVIDDVDSLEPEHQSDLFQTMVQVVNRTMTGNGACSSRILLTARLDLGASPGQLVRVKGLHYDEFVEYIKVTAESLHLPFTYPKKQLEHFHKASSGSPTFAASILRLLQTGESLAKALLQWEGSDGESVRQFAFQKELDQLTDSQTRALYALCILGQTSLIELEQVLQASSAALRDDLGELRKYHLLALGGEIPAGGATLEIPGAIRLMRGLIRERVADHTRIDRECAEARSKTPKAGLDARSIINRVIALWRDSRYDDALQVVKWAEGKDPGNPDIECLLGRAYLQGPQPDARQADKAFRKASKLGCSRPELFALWYEAKRVLDDWIGIIDVSLVADKIAPNADNVLLRAEAYLRLGNRAREQGNLSKAIEHYRAGGLEADKAFKNGAAQKRVIDLKEIRSELMSEYVFAADKLISNPNEYIAVWLAFLEAFKCFVRRPLLVRLGLRRLQSWWEAVEAREKHDSRTAEAMRVQLNELELVLDELNKFKDPDFELLSEATQVKLNLTKRWRSYLEQLPNGV